MIDIRMDYIIRNNDKGKFIFAGVADDGEEIFTVIEPKLKNTVFFYNCGSKFIIDRFEKYFDDYDGSMVFANGEECIIYIYDKNNGRFTKKTQFQSMIPNSHKKGGQSSVRFGRITDGIRTKYIITIIEHLNKLNLNNNWIFGSQDIISDVFSRKSEIVINITNGGFLNFTKDTINNTHQWISVLQNSPIDESKFQKAAQMIELADPHLEFDPNCTENLDSFEFIVITPSHHLYTEKKYRSKNIQIIRK